jgi:hypothetical protein
MQGKRDQTGNGERTSEVIPGELEWQNLLAKLSEFVADSNLSIPRIARLMCVSGGTLEKWMSGTTKPQSGKLLEIRSFLDLHRPPCLYRPKSEDRHRAEGARRCGIDRLC